MRWSLLLTLLSMATLSRAADERTCGKVKLFTFSDGEIIAVTNATKREDCCAQCGETDGCKVINYGGVWKGVGSQCYLMRNVRQEIPATVGGPVYETVWMSDYDGECNSQKWGVCGNSRGSSCCPNEYYCQPWNPDFYQCVPTPAQCEGLETDIDYYGNDLFRVLGISPDECCEKCAATPSCKTYTFIQQAVDGSQCYLKTSDGGRVRKVGAISGSVVRS
ncbi:hypothetical protein Poli38472_009154 [Pythium oligandrum]|uniref:Apple domain-containing protein n=1 Tax=Pythium oligandrum TaxID=41045 RepID=A0A8K1CK79_PYTOL|nr:hypothetical protein Poli38472_009154 [Pythium oligandrum]|eukprot:TMW64987.1 hypothetical protein Poli38472_009154 [Pythium oligandrum]